MPLSRTEVLLPGAYVENLGGSGTPINASKPFALFLVGQSAGQEITVTAEELVRGASTVDDALANSNVSEILWTSDNEGGPNGIYRLDNDYQLGTDEVDWLNTRLDIPVLDTPVVTEDVAGLAAGTYYYRIGFRRRLTAATYGETTGSGAQSAQIASSTGGNVALGWSVIPGVEQIRVYRSMTSGVWGATHLLVTLGAGVESYNDVGAVRGAGAPAANNTTLRAPYQGQSYFCSYKYVDTDFGVLNTYTKLSDLTNEHGKISSLGKAATLAMGTSGLGNGAPLVLAVGTQYDVDNLSEHQAALALAQGIRDYPLLMVPVSTNMDIINRYSAHINEMNDVRVGQYRMGLFGPKFTASYGDTTTVGSIIYNARSLNNKWCAYVAPGFVYADVIDESGDITETALDGSYLAAALAGKIAAMGDAAEPATFKFLEGFKRFATAALRAYDPTDPTILKLLQSSGVSNIVLDLGRFKVSQAVSTSLASQEAYHWNIQTEDIWLQYSLKKNLDNSGIIGKKNIDTNRKAIKDVIVGTMDAAVASTQIVSYSEPDVYQDPTNKDWVVAAWSYKPIYPINVIYAYYVFDTSV